MKIGVFDSGIGGLSVAEAIQKELPDYEVIFMKDDEHFPYGSRGVDEIYDFTKPIIQTLIDEGCAVLVVACNTVTTNFIDKLRTDFNVPLIGMEPMVKPAAKASKTGVIAVCATPLTLASKRYAQLKEQFAQNVKVLEPDCGDWAAMVEADNVNREKIAKTINDICNSNADQIVLGCTHYHWIESVIKETVNGRAEVIQPEIPVIKQLKKVLEQLA
jgi:glutamate racemase